MLFNPKIKGTPKPKISGKCPFCEIVNGERAADIILDDGNFIGFLDIRPHGIGHTLVIPRNHYRWVWDIPNVGGLLETAKRIVKAIQAAFDPHLVVGGIVGDEVPHAHLHLIPRYLQPPNPSTPGEIAEKIRAKLNAV